MRLPTALRSLVYFLILVWASSALSQSSQPLDPHHVDAGSLGGPVDLTSAFLLHAGDDPSFASPTLDDSHWLLALPSHALSSYGIEHPDLLWYRTHVHIPPSSHNLAIELRAFVGSCQIFVNGVQVAASGHMENGGDVSTGSDLVYPIPDALISSGELTIAVRASVARAARNLRPGFNGDPYSALTLGTRPDLETRRTLFFFRSYTSNSANIILEGIVLLIALALALALRSEREYLALAVSYAATITGGITVVWVSHNNVPEGLIVSLLRLWTNVVLAISFIEFVRMALSLPRTRALVRYGWSVGFAGLVIGTTFSFLSSRPQGIPSRVELALTLFVQVLLIPYFVGLPLVALWVWLKRRNLDGLLLFPALFLRSAFSYYLVGTYLLARFHVLQSSTIPLPPIRAIYVGWIEILDFFFNISILVFLVLRTIRIARSRANFAAEFKAAQSVQQLLLARSSQPTAGFTVETVYHPASEVGGDFFLISPGPDSSLVAIIGDVSGKGLTAALRVSMILGVLRRESSREPAHILTALNEILVAQGDTGFTTACCLRLERSGHFRVANAGHINPYLTQAQQPSTPQQPSIEFLTPASLPLGIAPNQDYETLSGKLHTTQTLVLLSDGVPEARSTTGKLYGFDNLPALLHHPAPYIAETAQTFGQEDDITVITITCA